MRKIVKTEAGLSQLAERLFRSVAPGLVCSSSVSVVLLSFFLSVALPSPSARNEPVETWHLQRAEAIASAGDWEGAIEELRRAVRSNPSSRALRLRLADAYAKVGKPDQALHHLKWLTRNDPADTEALRLLGSVLEAVGRKGEALTVLSRAYAREPTNPDIRVALARILIATGRWQEAIGHLKWVLHRHPDFAPGHYHLAVFYESQGDGNRALHHAVRTVQITRGNPDALLLAFRLSLKLSRHRQADAFAGRIQRLFPKNPEIFLEMGRLYGASERWDRAVVFLKRAHRLNPRSTTPLPLLAEALTQLGRWREALSVILRLRQFDPKSPDLLHAQFQCYLRIGPIRRARATLARWIQFHPRDFRPYLFLARLESGSGKIKASLNAYRHAVTRRPPTQVLAEAAAAEERFGDLERALQLYERLQSRDNGNPRWRAKRVELLMRLKRYHSARLVLAAALKRFPEDQPLNALMGLWLARMVRWDEAVGFLQKAIGNDKTGRSQGARDPFVGSLKMEALGTLVELYLCQGRWRDAAVTCEGALAADPKPEILVWWAQAMAEGGKGREAVQRLEKSAALHSGYLPAVQVVASLWLALGQEDRSQAVWDQWIKSKDQGEEAFARAARFWLSAGRPKNAYALAERGLSRSPRSRLLRTIRVEAFLAANGFTAALKEASLLLKEKPDDSLFASLYARAALGLWGGEAGEVIAARLKDEPHLAAAERLVRLQVIGSASQAEPAPASGDGWAAMAQGRSQKTIGHDWEQAQRSARDAAWRQVLKHARAVVSAQPSFLPAWDLLVEGYWQTGQLEAVLSSFVGAANRFREDLGVNYGCARALDRINQFRRSVTYWRRVCALTDHDPQFLLGLKNALEKSGQSELAGWIQRFVDRLSFWERGINETSRSAVSDSAN